jgi:hypothetical protein
MYQDKTDHHQGRRRVDTTSQRARQDNKEKEKKRKETAASTGRARAHGRSIRQ